MPVFLWNESYCIGEALIDCQHQYLFQLANDLVESDDKAQLTENAINLFKYVKEHFSHEESVMRKINYPAYREHVAMHDELINQLSAISSDISIGQGSVADLQNFMNNWLLGHIIEVDTKLAKYMQKQE